MTGFLLRRTLRLVLTLAASAVLVFFALRVIPGDPALVIAGVDASAEDIERIRSSLGTDRDLVSQFVDWIADLAQLRFGESLVGGEPVAALIAERMPTTALVALTAMLLALVLAIPLGVAAAASRPGSRLDIAAVSLAQIGMSVPGF